MSSTSIPESSSSTALVPYISSRPHSLIKSDIERIVDAVYKHSLEVAKFETRVLTAGPPHLDPTTVREARSRRLHQIMPPLTGPHSVGYTCLIIEGPKGTHFVGDSKIGIEIYVPTKNEAGNKTTLEFPAGHLERMLSSEQIQTFRTHSHDQIDLIEKARILIFSHGLGTPPIEYRLLLEELASHGYLVLSLNHPSSSGYAPFGEEDPPNWDALDDPARREEEFERLASAQAENIHHVIELIRNGGILGMDACATDPIVVAGHSLGGAASIIATRNDPRIVGCIDLDGALIGKRETRTVGLEAPALVISSDHRPYRSKVGEKGFEEEQQIEQDFESFLKNPSVISHTIDDINHMDFCFMPIVRWLTGEDTLANALKAHREASQAMLKFMNSIPV